MSRISSLTDTIGLSSPHSCCGPIGAGSAGAPEPDGGAADFEDEQAGIQAEITRTRQDAQAILALVPMPPFTPTPITSSIVSKNSGLTACARATRERSGSSASP